MDTGEIIATRSTGLDAIAKARDKALAADPPLSVGQLHLEPIRLHFHRAAEGINKELDIRRRIARFNGGKSPKKKSTGIPSLAPEIETILGDRQTSHDKLGCRNTDDFELPGSSGEEKDRWRRRHARDRVIPGARHARPTRPLDRDRDEPAAGSAGRFAAPA